MLAVDRTAELFITSIESALPDASVTFDRYKSNYGYSKYVFINLPTKKRLKVRISDHAIGMRRAISGECDLFLQGGNRPQNWSIWLSKLVKYRDDPKVNFKLKFEE